MLPVPASVLVIDDNKDLDKILPTILTPLGTTFKRVAGSKEVEATLRDEPRWDMVLVDYYLTGETGASLLPALRTALPDATLVLLSVDPRAFSLCDGQNYDAVGLLSPSDFADPDSARDAIIKLHCSSKLHITSKPMNKTVKDLLTHAKSNYARYSSESLPSFLASIPEMLFQEQPGEVVELPHAIAGGSTDCMGVITHSLSPWGESITLLASLGRDARIMDTLGLSRRSAYIQGLGLLACNKSIATHYPKGVPLDQWARNVSFRKKVYRSVGFRPVVVDVAVNPGVDVVLNVEDWVSIAHQILSHCPEQTDRSGWTSALGTLEEEPFLREKVRAQLASWGREEENDTFQKVIHCMKAALNVSGSLDDSTLRYFFRSVLLLEGMTGPVLRIGPPYEKFTDAVASAGERGGALNVQTMSAKRKSGDGVPGLSGQGVQVNGVYFQDYNLSGKETLPYTLLSGSMRDSTPEEAKEVSIVLGENDSEDQILRCLKKTNWFSVCRLFSDLISFVVHCRDRRDFVKLVSAGDKIDRHLGRSLAILKDGPEKSVILSSSWVERNGDATVPPHLIPYLLPTERLWSQETAYVLKLICEFGLKIGYANP